jgi:hypothetical protein
MKVCGLVGRVILAVPGTPRLLVAAIAHRLCLGAASANNQVLAGLLVGESSHLAMPVVQFARPRGPHRISEDWDRFATALRSLDQRCLAGG